MKSLKKELRRRSSFALANRSAIARSPRLLFSQHRCSSVVPFRFNAPKFPPMLRLEKPHDDLPYQQGSHGEPIDVLLIEDSPSDAMLVDQQLRDSGGDAIHVTTVTDLAEALEMTANRHFDAALLDLNLPDSQGIATFDELHSAAPELPLVVLSGIANADIALNVLRKGAQDCVLKSEVPGALLDRVIRLAIERQKIARQLDDRFERLERNESRIREIIEESREAFIALDSNRIVTFANDAAANMLSRSADKLIGKSFVHGIPDGGLMDLSIRRSDGTPGVGELRIIGRTSDADAGTLLSLRDVTERRRADGAIRDSEIRFRALLEHSVDSILLVDAEGRMKYASPSAAAITGYDDPDLRDIDCLAFMFADDMDKLRRMRGELDAHPKQPQVVKWRFRNNLGRTLYFEGVATNLLAAPAIGGIVLNFRDATERHRVEETQRQSQKMEALGTLAGGIAHDFNNILLAISGNARLAIATTPPDHASHQTLVEIEKASQRAADLVRRILAFSRRDTPNRQVVDLRDALDEVIKLLRATLPAAIELKVRSIGNMPRVLADVTQVHQVILNLVTNAAHAIGERRGTINVELDESIVDDQTAVTIGEISGGRYARVSIIDDGSGIEPEMRSRIFEPFFTTKEKGQGTGLGLSVAHGIMLEHDGAISVHSELGKGSIFRLYFPATVEQPIIEKRQPSASPNGRGESILYVDDEEALTFLARRVLQFLGYKVATYTNPKDALREFESDPSKYQAIVSDLSMPGMSGFRFAEAIRAIHSAVPIILTSGYIRQEDRDQATKLGIDDLILKPNTMEELGATLNRCLREKFGK